MAEQRRLVDRIKELEKIVTALFNDSRLINQLYDNYVDLSNRCSIIEKELGLSVQPKPMTAMESTTPSKVTKYNLTLEKKKKKWKSATYIPCPVKTCSFQGTSLSSLRSHLVNSANRGNPQWWQKHKQYTEAEFWKNYEIKKHGAV